MIEKEKQISTYVDAETKRLINMAAADDNVPVSKYLRRLIQADINRRIGKGSITPPKRVEAIRQ